MQFVYYLQNKGLITKEQVVEVLDRQRLHAIPVGKLARMEGLLTEKQVYEVLNRQKSVRRPFGKVAVDLGYLTSKELSDLLLLQGTRVSMDKLLVDLGVLTSDVVSAEIALFRSDHPDGKIG